MANQNQNKKEKLTTGGEHCFICKEETVGQTCYRIHVECATPSPKSSYWEEELKSYMVDLIDEYFSKDNQDNPELPSTTHRSEAMASHALFLIKFKEVFASERERVLNEVLEKMPREKCYHLSSVCNCAKRTLSEIKGLINSLKGEK